MSAKQLNAELLTLLECPVCLETCVPPIYMCGNGHIVCAKCQPQLDACGECRLPGAPHYRCWIMEKTAGLVKLPCTNKPFGCKLDFKIGNLAEHMPKCDHGFKCHVCKEWAGCAADLKSHVLEKHPQEYLKCMSSDSEVMLTSTIDEDMMIKDCPYVYLLDFNDDIFWFENKYTSETHFFSHSVRIVSHKENEAKRYFYSFEFKSDDNLCEDRVYYQTGVQSYDATATDIVIPACIVDSFSKGSIEYTFKITQRSSVLNHLTPAEPSDLGLLYTALRRFKISVQSLTSKF